MAARIIGCRFCAVLPPAEFFLFGAMNVEPSHIFVFSYFGFWKFAVLLDDNGYRQSHETQAKYNNG
jgi:hypothetical protein